MAKAYIMIADITGSTALYDQMSDADALAQISVVLDRMRAIIRDNGGHCIKSQGDDTLSHFHGPDQAFQAARSMIETEWKFGLAVHVGVYRGDFLTHQGDIYGDAINTTARLASLSKPGEVLVGGNVFEKLSEDNRALFVSMGGLKLKGKSKPTRIHSFSVGALDAQTVFVGSKSSIMGRRTESVELRLGDSEWSLTDGQSITVGRSPDCEAVLQHPWVSRKHGSFDLRAAQLEYSDHSSSGSTVVTSDGREYALKRRSMLLNGAGMILVGTDDRDHQESIIHYSTNDLVPDAV